MTKHDSGKSPDPKSVTMGFVAAINVEELDTLKG